VKGTFDILVIGGRVRKTENCMKESFIVLAILLNVDQVTIGLIKRLVFEPGHPLISSRGIHKRGEMFAYHYFFVFFA
jgi:hypothetical protein